MAKGEKIKVGRTKYDTLVKPKLILIAGWAKRGLTDKDIAANLGVSVASFSEYKKVNAELFEALRITKEEFDYTVENALAKSAVGYDYEEKIYEVVNGEKILVKVLQKHQPPNGKDAFNWLKNRMAKEWRDRQHINHGGSVISNVVEWGHLSDDDLRAMLNEHGISTD